MYNIKEVRNFLGDKALIRDYKKERTITALIGNCNQDILCDMIESKLFKFKIKVMKNNLHLTFKDTFGPSSNFIG